MPGSFVVRWKRDEDGLDPDGSKWWCTHEDGTRFPLNMRTWLNHPNGAERKNYARQQKHETKNKRKSAPTRPSLGSPPQPSLAVAGANPSAVMGASAGSSSSELQQEPGEDDAEPATKKKMRWARKSEYTHGAAPAASNSTPPAQSAGASADAPPPAPSRSTLTFEGVIFHVPDEINVASEDGKLVLTFNEFTGSVVMSPQYMANQEREISVAKRARFSETSSEETLDEKLAASKQPVTEVFRNGSGLSQLSQDSDELEEDLAVPRTISWEDALRRLNGQQAAADDDDEATQFQGPPAVAEEDFEATQLNAPAAPLAERHDLISSDRLPLVQASPEEWEAPVAAVNHAHLPAHTTQSPAPAIAPNAFAERSLVGLRVVVHGLVSRPDLNGRIAHVNEFSAASGGYIVSVQSGKGHETLALRQLNLLPTTKTQGEVAEGLPQRANVPPAGASEAASSVATGRLHSQHLHSAAAPVAASTCKRPAAKQDGAAAKKPKAAPKASEPPASGSPAAPMNHRVSPSSGLSPYEQERQANMLENQVKLTALGLSSSIGKQLANKRKSPKAKASAPAVPQPKPPPTDSAAWMDKPNVKNFPIDKLDYFGMRIEMKKKPQGQMEKAVIKVVQPCNPSGFGIVFDSDKPGQEPRFENLFRRGRDDWKVIPWESDDLEETAELRPMCPKCGHPLGVGRRAWTFCIAKDALGKPCGNQEPGAMSHCQLTRRSQDIYANPAAAPGFYSENDTDSD